METVNKTNNILRSLDVSPLVQLADYPGTYVTEVTMGSATIMIGRVIKDQRDNILLSSDLVLLPQKNIEGLYRFILELNVIYGGYLCFGVKDNIVKAVSMIDGVLELTKDSFFGKLSYFANECDRYDDELASRFHAVHIGYES